MYKRCAAMGCRRKVELRGVCRKHYLRWFKLEDKGTGPFSRIELISNEPEGRKDFSMPNEPIGTRKLHSNGYVYIKVDHEHVLARKDRPNGTWVLEHRAVMAEHIGRALQRKEFVKHKDGNKENNTLDNLYIVGT